MPSEQPSPAIASLLDALVVLADVDASSPGSLRDGRHCRSTALRKPARSTSGSRCPAMARSAWCSRECTRWPNVAARRPAGAMHRPAGSDLFYASCGLMSAGAETVLLSRWRVGGQSTLDAVREFVQELPHAAAADAWQRSVQLLMAAPVDPGSEMRVKAGTDGADLVAKHPFFWAGYFVVDSGWRPEQDGKPGGVPAEPVLELPDAGAPAASSASSRDAGRGPRGR